MTIYFSDDFDPSVDAGWTTATGAILAGGRTGQGYQLEGGHVQKLVKTITGVSSIRVKQWFSLATNSGTNEGGTAWDDKLGFLSLWEGTTKHLVLHAVVASGAADLYLYIGSSTTPVANTTGSPITGAWSQVIVDATIHDTTGSVSVVVDGVEVLTYSGDTRNGGTGVIDKVQFGTNDSAGVSGVWRDGIVIADQTETFDGTPPTITSKTPADLATAVDVDAPIVITFSETMYEAGLSQANRIQLAKTSDLSTLVSRTYSYNPATFTLTVTHPSLEYNTEYRVRVIGGSTGVLDVEGNELAADEIWTFTTELQPPPNDDYEDALVVNLLAGSFVDPAYSGTIAVSGMSIGTLQAGEPAVSGISVSGTLWYALDGDADWPGFLSLDLPTYQTVRADVFTGTAVSGLTHLHTSYSLSAGGGVNTLNEFIPPGRVYVRVYSGDDTTTIDWNYFQRMPEVIFTVNSSLEQAPGTILVTVTNVEPDSTVTFSSPSHADFFSVTVDSTGAAYNVSVPISWSLAAGMYNITAETTYGSVTTTFAVLADADMRPAVPSAITAPAAPDPDPVVNKWIVTDPYDSTTWVFPYNPHTASTPHTPKAYSFETTTAPDGQVLTWEGAPEAVQWAVKGYSHTQAFYEKLESLVNSNKRYWLTDHRLRRWYVSFEIFDPTPKKDVSNPNWSFEYGLTINLYYGPVTS